MSTRKQKTAIRKTRKLDSQFEKALHRTICKYYVGKTWCTPHIVWKQHGGGQLLYQFRGKTYYTRENLEGNLFVIRSGRKPPSTECITIFLEDTNEATLQQIKFESDCAEEKGAPAADLVQLAVLLCRRHGVKRIRLTDDSTKHLPDERPFRVSDASFLSTGYTWYERLIPYKWSCSLEMLEIWRERVCTNKWYDVESCLRKEDPLLIIPVDISDIDILQPGSAMIVFNRISKERTNFFAKYDTILTTCSKMNSLFGGEWTFDLTAPLST